MESLEKSDEVAGKVGWSRLGKVGWSRLGKVGWSRWKSRMESLETDKRQLLGRIVELENEVRISLSCCHAIGFLSCFDSEHISKPYT